MRPESGRLGRAGVAVGSGFLLTGVVSVLLGPIIPELRSGWNVTQAQAASLFVAQFTASSIGAVVSGFNLRRSLAGGYLLVGAGLAGLATGGWSLALPALCLMGLGLGLVIPASNLFVAHRNPGSRSSSLATLNFVWGLGAVSSPLLIAGLRDLKPLEEILAGLAAVAALTGLAVWLCVTDDASPGAPATPREGGPAGGASLGFLGLTAAMLFLYVGTENAVGGWLVTLPDDLGSDRSAASLFIGSGFWGALLLGRAITPWVLRLRSEATTYKLFLTLATAGTLLLVLSGSRAHLAAGALLAGLGMAPLFPFTVSMLAAATAATRSRTAGWVLACGGLGGAALPWLTGRLGDGTGTLHHGFLVPLAGLIGLAAIYGLGRAWGE
jgi:FHS family glucose/mannose:H+ symporter-like MFS transporter